MDNNKTWLIINSFEELLKHCGIEHDRIVMYHQAISNYREAMTILRQKEDLTNDQITIFQSKIDVYFQNWVSLHSADGITNYIHMLGAGHLSDYLFEWRNLY